MSIITKVFARQILDSRGNPTVEVDVETEDSFGRASVPSGASTGKREAMELRDLNQEVYLGKSVLKAVSNVNEIIAPQIIGLDAFDQKLIDQKLCAMDGTENKSRLGANAILGVSMAACRAEANARKLPLYVYLNSSLKVPCEKGCTLPAPLMNILNGGAHASNGLDIQEFMIIPHMKKPFSENLRAGVEVFHTLKKVLKNKGFSTNVGDEGGLAPALTSNEEALDFIIQAIKDAGYTPGSEISISLDCAASEFYVDQHYEMNKKTYSTRELIEYYVNLVEKYPIYSIEDGLAEDDLLGWRELTHRLGNQIVIVGDDLFVTNRKILERGIRDQEANAILIKVNQIGTLTETFETMQLAFDSGMSAIISHRSGETGDTFISDLSVATGAGHIKTGSASRSDRIEKYNQLLRIEEELGDKAIFHRIQSH